MNRVVATIAVVVGGIEAGAVAKPAPKPAPAVPVPPAPASSTPAPAQSTASGLIVSQTAIPESRRQITFDEAMLGTVTLTFSDYAAGPIELYEKDASTHERSNSCRLPVESSKVVLNERARTTSAACNELLAPLFDGRPFEIAVGIPSPTANAITTVHAVVSYSPPKKYQGGSASITVATHKVGDDNPPDWTSAKVPSAVRLKSTGFVIKLDRWHDLTWDPASRILTPSDDLKAVIEARWAAGKPVSVVAKAIDADTSTDGDWRTFELTLKQPEKPVTKPETPKTSLETRCRSAVAGVSRKSFYLVCVDAYATKRGIVTLSCSTNDGTKCDVIGELVDSRHAFVVAVWRDLDTQEDVTLSGAAGHADYVRQAPDLPSPTFDKLLGKVVEGLEEVETPQTLWTFDSRKDGDISLVVKVTKRKDDGSSVDVVNFPWKYSVQKYYKLAVRFGVGVTWTPYDREIGVEVSSNGQHYSAVKEGDGRGLVNSDLVAGLSWFPWEVKGDTLSPALALGLRLGLLSVGNSGKWFRSVMVGPELAFGPDISLGVFAGFALNDLPDSGYEPGKLLPTTTNSISTHLGFTPAFGVALNLTPGFVKSVGVSK